MGLSRPVGMAPIAISIAMVACAVAIAAVTLSDTTDAYTSYSISLRLLDQTNSNSSANGSLVHFNFTVTNPSGWSFDVAINMTYPPQGWGYDLSLAAKAGTFRSNGTVVAHLESDESATLHVTIIPTANNTNGTYWMTLLAWVMMDATVNESMRLGVTIGRFVGFELEVLNEPKEGYFAAIPPSMITVRFAIVNTGTERDRFLVRYYSSLSDAGWTIRPVRGIDGSGWTEYVLSDPGGLSPYFIDFQIPIPAEEKGNVKCRVGMNATSTLDQPERVRSANTTIWALQYYDFQVYISGEDKKRGAPGEEVEFYLRIWNRGNGWDVISITPFWDEQLNPGFTAFAIPRTINITSNITEQVRFIVKVPHNASKNSYFFSAKVSSSSRELAVVTKLFEVEVTQSYGIELSCPQPLMSAIPGGILVYDIYVRNAGNALDFMAISILGAPAGWLSYVLPPEVALAQDEKALISIQVIVPSSFEEAPQGLYDLTVQADSTRSDAGASLTIQAEVAPLHRILWTNLDQLKPPRSINPYERNSFFIELEIKNFGNTEDTVFFSGDGLDPRITVSLTPGDTILSSGQTRTLKVRIEVAKELPPGDYKAFVDATTQDGTYQVESVPLDFSIHNMDVSIPAAPALHDLGIGNEILGTVTMGRQAVVWLSVRNNGTKPLGSVQVRAFDTHVQDGKVIRLNFFSHDIRTIPTGQTYAFPHFNDATADPAILWSANVMGAHTLEFRVFYDYQSNVTNDAVYLNLTVLGAPRPAQRPHESRLGAVGLALSLAVLAIACLLIVRRRRASREPSRRTIEVDPAAFERTLPPFEPEPDKVALMPRPTREHVELYGQDLDGEEVDQVIEKEADLSEDEVGP